MGWVSLWLSLLSSSILVLSQGHVTDYAPSPNVQCPTENLLRVFTPQNQSLNPLESAYINARESTVIPAAWEAWLGDGSAIGYNLSAFAGNYSRIGIALSGGGLRAAQYGAGVLSGLDARNDSAMAAGTGGLLQVSSYIAALSGMSSYSVAIPLKFINCHFKRRLLVGQLPVHEWLAHVTGFGLRERQQPVGLVPRSRRDYPKWYRRFRRE